jgi:hypothetical protein
MLHIAHAHIVMTSNLGVENESVVRFRSSLISVKRDGEYAMPVKREHDQIMWYILYSPENGYYSNVNRRQEDHVRLAKEGLIDKASRAWFF